MKTLISAALLFAAGPALAADKPMPFLAEAAQGDQAEVEMGKLAQTHGLSAKVRGYGETLVTDHGGHRPKVVALAKAKGVKVPTAVNAEQKAAFLHLSQMQGAAFDTAFKAHMIEDHQKDIAKYRAQLTSADADTAALARETLPVLERHLELARAL